jgi:6-phosphogluconolactonase
MNFKRTFTLAVLLTASAAVHAQSKYHVLVGTYTSPGKSEGIYVYEFDAKTAAMTLKNKVAVNSPSYLAISNDRQYVYAVNEDKSSNVSAFKYNPKTGALKLLNQVPSGSSGPTYISIDATSKYVFAANYGGGTLTALPIQKDGSLGKDIQDIKHEGHSIAMKKPYVHSAVPSPDNRFVIAADLGTDKLNIYKFDATKRPKVLTPAAQPFFLLKPGSGPRHSTFHPNKKYYYAVTELNSTVAAFEYKDGTLKLLQTVSMLPEDYTGKGDGADIHISPDGKFLYASTRNVLNQIVIYAIDQQSGKLTQVGRQSTEGKSSRTFAMDPTGNWLLVTNQGTNTIVVFKRDLKTGLLKPQATKLDIDKPSFVQFVKID